MSFSGRFVDVVPVLWKQQWARRKDDRRQGFLPRLRESGAEKACPLLGSATHHRHSPPAFWHTRHQRPCDHGVELIRAAHDEETLKWMRQELSETCPTLPRPRIDWRHRCRGLISHAMDGRVGVDGVILRTDEVRRLIWDILRPAEHLCQSQGLQYRNEQKPTTKHPYIHTTRQS